MSSLFDLQPKLVASLVTAYPLEKTDFEELFSVASDPKIWEQHPNKDRWKMEAFKVFFDGALLSKGAYKIVNKTNGNVIGCTRFYDYNEKECSILIGYTFYGRLYWGKGYNISVKKLMLDYIFKYVSIVYFHIGALNIRSQMAISKLGTTKIDEMEVTYFGEKPKLNYIYKLTKDEWHKLAS